MTAPTPKKSVFGKCRKCEAPIIWALKIESGRPHPFDKEPVEKGKWMLIKRGDSGEVEAWDHDDREGANRFQSHFKSCPNEEEFRSKKGRR